MSRIAHTRGEIHMGDGRAVRAVCGRLCVGCVEDWQRKSRCRSSFTDSFTAVKVANRRQPWRIIGCKVGKAFPQDRERTYREGGASRGQRHKLLVL